MATIYELPPDRFEVARPVLSDPPADWAYIDAGLTGVNRARVFVDDPEHADAALMCRTYEYFVGGRPGTALDDFIRDAPVEAEVWGSFYGFVAVEAAWNDHLWALHPELTCIGRRSYRFDTARIETVRGSASRIPEGLQLAPLTVELAEMADREMPEIIGMFWGGYDRYAAHGFGALMLDGDKPVAITYAVAVGGGEANVGVMTDKDYRRRGLATLTSQACIEMAQERGLVATWDCDTLNVPSGLLAQSIGFTEQPPFQELAFPSRAKPKQSMGLWSRQGTASGVIRWSRTPAA